MRATLAPPPAGRTLPTWISSTRLMSTPERSTTALKTATRRSSGQVSLKPPFLARVNGVRAAAHCAGQGGQRGSGVRARARTMTTSLSFLVRSAFLPCEVGSSCEAMAETREVALTVVRLQYCSCSPVFAASSGPARGPATA